MTISLRNEVRASIDRLLSVGLPLMPSLIAADVCSRHMSGIVDDGSDDAAHWLYCAYARTRHEARETLNAMGDAVPGYPHLQAFYVVERNGDSVAVAIDDLTEAEFDVKIAMHIAIGEGLLGHAGELRHFSIMRGRPA